MRKTIVELLDDLDNSVKATDTITFSLDGDTYEIDLSEKNLTKLHDQMAPWIMAARRVGGRRQPTRTQQARKESSVVREWAKRNGHHVAPRGRIPDNVMDAWRKAQ